MICIRFDDAVLEATRELDIYCLFPHASLSSDAREFWRTKQYIPHIRIVTIKYLGLQWEKKLNVCFLRRDFFFIVLQESACEVVDCYGRHNVLRAFDFNILDGDVSLQIPDFHC